MIGRILAVVFLLGAGCAQPKYVKKDDAINSAVHQIKRGKLSGSDEVWLQWEKFPQGDDLGAFILKFGRANLADQSPLPQDFEGEVEVELWMPSMGHGSTPVTVHKVDTGTYRIGEVFFTMPGDWDIRVRRVVDGVIVDTVVFSLRI